MTDKPTPGSAATVALCPNTKRHHDYAWASIKDIPSYKREMRDGFYRSAYESDQRRCDFCWPPCPTCGHRERRKP